MHGFLRLFIYIFIGYILATNYKKIISKTFQWYCICTGLLVLLFVIENFVIWHFGGSSNSQEVITTVPTSTFVAIFSLKWEPKVKTMTCRKFSTFLYCSQMWIFFILSKFFLLTSFVNELITFILVILISFIGYKIYDWIKNTTEWPFWRYMV